MHNRYIQRGEDLPVKGGGAYTHILTQKSENNSIQLKVECKRKQNQLKPDPTLLIPPIWRTFKLGVLSMSTFSASTDDSLLSDRSNACMSGIFSIISLTAVANMFGRFNGMNVSSFTNSENKKDKMSANLKSKI